MTTAAQTHACGICDGTLDANAPGNARGTDGTLEHAVCHERRAPPRTPIATIPTRTTTARAVHYNCGHHAIGPAADLPTTCPECGDEQV